MPSPRLPVTFSSEADEDLIQIWGYLAREASEEMADRQLHKIEQVCTRLQDWPFSGRPRDELLPGMRSALADPYVVFYRIELEAIQIIRVLHGRRDIASIFGRRAEG